MDQSGRSPSRLATERKTLLELLEVRFPRTVPNDVVQLIQQQDSREVLLDWFDAAARAYSFDQFLAVLKK